MAATVLLRGYSSGETLTLLLYPMVGGVPDRSTAANGEGDEMSPDEVNGKIYVAEGVDVAPATYWADVVFDDGDSYAVGVVHVFDGQVCEIADQAKFLDAPVSSTGCSGVNVVVSPMTAKVPDDIRQNTLYLRLADTSRYRIESVKGVDGTEIDFSAYESLDMIFETRKKQTLETITLADIELINEGRGIAFRPSMATVGSETMDDARHLWAVRDPDDVGGDGQGRVICGGDCVVRRFAMERI